jgi:DNA-binding transcriptional ArsR family regulator
MANNAAKIDRSFVAFSHPIRRRIVERLAEGPATVGEASSGIRVSKPTISKHLRVLEDAGVVRRSVEGRTHRLRLEDQPLADAASWIDRQRELWERKFDVVEEYLAEKPIVRTRPSRVLRKKEAR